MASTGTAIDWDRRSIWDKHLGAHMIHARRDIFPEYLIKLRCVNGGSGREQR